tara:strand:+ start:2339 stop:2920 length:582 start_codon:yes stop_codon:yes gene_type:complete
MNRKLLLQIFLISLTLIISVIFFNQTFKNEKDILVKKENKIKLPEDNLIEGIKYFSKDIEGNTYLIESKNGTLDQDNPDIIYLVDVVAEINFDKNQKIEVTSNKAIYNVSNFDTEFTDNVKLTYDDNEISCKNITVKFSENYAILDGNLIFKNLLTSLYADRMEVDLTSRKTKTSMNNNKDKVTIIYKNYGIN